MKFLIAMLVGMGLCTASPTTERYNRNKINEEIRIFAIENCLTYESGERIYNKLSQLKGWREALRIIKAADGVILTESGVSIIIENGDYSFSFKDKTEYYEINPN